MEMTAKIDGALITGHEPVRSGDENGKNDTPCLSERDHDVAGRPGERIRLSDSEQDDKIDDVNGTMSCMGGDSSEQDCLIQNEVQIRPKEKTSLFVYLLTFFSAIGGFLFGYDTGVVSGAMIQVSRVFALQTVWQELVVSITIGAAALFAAVAGFSNDLLGRKPTILFASVVFTVGAVLLGVAVNVVMLLIGRLVVGIGIGLASSTVPLYIAECAPSHIRGRLVIVNNVFITGGQFIASVVDGLFSGNRQNGWRYMLGLAGVPSCIMFAGFFFMPESPRWLVKKGREVKARLVLEKIRGHSDVDRELTEIKDSHIADQQNSDSSFVPLKILRTPHVLKALIIGCGLQIFQQITGINTVMYYSATIIKMSGIQSESMAIWLSALTASVNFFFTFIGLYLVERIGRRPLTIGSIAGTFVSLLVLAVGFHMAFIFSPAVTEHYPFELNSTCNSYSFCGNCVHDSACGFCYTQTSSGISNASCLIRAKEGSVGLPCNSTQSSGSQVWMTGFCPTQYAWMATFGLVLYLAFFAPGMGPMPWTINSEIYPLWARSSAIAISTACNWSFNLLVSMTFLTLTEALTRHGAFYLYSGFAFLGLIFVCVFVPETKGKSLEEIESLFKKSSFSRGH